MIWKMMACCYLKASFFRLQLYPDHRAQGVLAAGHLSLCQGRFTGKAWRIWSSGDLLRRGLLLEYTTLAWNVVGTVVIVAAAINARSVALAGFGLDSLIEIFASMIVVWQLKGTHERRERTALRCIAGAFVALIVIWIFELPLDHQIRAVRVIGILVGFERGLIVVAIAEDRSGYIVGVKVHTCPQLPGRFKRAYRYPGRFETASWRL
jgi:hypothetical protein